MSNCVQSCCFTPLDGAQYLYVHVEVQAKGADLSPLERSRETHLFTNMNKQAKI